jgi:LVIVD repeat
MKLTRSKIGAPLAVFAAISVSAFANPRAAKPTSQSVTVIAHLATPGPFAEGMLVHEEGHKRYLYIDQASKNGFAVVDVTNPTEPLVVNGAHPGKQSLGGGFRLVGGGLLLAEATESDSTAADPHTSTSTVKVLDLSDPANPQIVLSFSGVIGTLADEAHNLIYITNQEGLWILRNNKALAAAAKRGECTTSDAFDEVASCE